MDIVKQMERYLKDYNNPEYKFRGKVVPPGYIDLLDSSQFTELVKDGPILAKCTLKYPFEKSYGIAVLIDTQIHTFEQIWGALTYMFTTIKHSASMNGLYNVASISERFGRAYHVLSDLVPEGMVYNPDTKEVKILIGS